MGGKRTRGWNKIYLCVAILIFLSLAACTPSKWDVVMKDTTGKEASEHLALGKKFLYEGNFDSALRENEKVLSLAGRDVPAVEALFYIGLIHAHPSNPKKDYGKSTLLFEKLIREYPESPLTDQAQTIVALIRENDRIRQVVDGLNKDVANLKKMNSGIEQKRAEVEQKRTEQTRIITGLQQENDRLNRVVDRLNNVIDELRQVDIDVEQMRRQKRR